jgi:Ala-tRNA(Pro) deacylase
MYTVDFLLSRHVWFEPLLHCPASSSTQRAHCMHVPGHQVAKTVLIKAGERFVLVVLPSTSRIDLARLGELIGRPAAEVRLATDDELVNLFTDCQPGVVPPFGRLYDLDTVFDASLMDVPELVFGGNTRHEGLRMRSADYITIEQPRIGSFAVPIVPGQSIPPLAQPDRRAG